MNGNNNITSKYAKFLVVVGVLAGSSSGIFGALTTAPSLAIGFWRLTITLPFFAIPVLIKSRDTLKSIKRRDWIFAVLAGVFLFGHYFTWFSAVKLTKVTSAVVLAALHPLVVLFCTVFIFKRKVSLGQVIAIIAALIGASIITFADTSGSNVEAVNPVLGDICAFAAGVFMGIYFQFGNEARTNIPGPTYVLICFTTCWICFIISCLVTQTPVLGYPGIDYVYFVAMALVCQIGSHAILNVCLGHVDALYVSTWESGEMLFATILSIIILGQYPTALGWIGCFIVTFALIYYNYKVKKDAEKLAVNK